MLVVIGKQWLTVADPITGRRRLDDADDVLREEVVTALRRGVRVVPVPVDGASVPAADALPEDLRSLPDKQALWFPRDTDKLLELLEHDVSPRAQAQAAVEDAGWASYAAPAAGAAPFRVIFSVNPEAKDVFIAFTEFALLLLLVLLVVFGIWWGVKHYGAQSA